MRAFFVIALVSTACSPAPEEHPDVPVDTPSVDAQIVCDDLLELGHCRSRTTGEPCRGAEGPDAVFVAVADGAPLAPVLGPQGAQMLVLAARTRGIAPGDVARPTDSGNPVLRVFVHDSRGVEVASYQGRGAFVPDGSDPELLVRPDVYVITELPLRGSVGALAVVRDRDGIEHCGRLDMLMP